MIKNTNVLLNICERKKKHHYMNTFIYNIKLIKLLPLNIWTSQNIP